MTTTHSFNQHGRVTYYFDAPEDEYKFAHITADDGTVYTIDSKSENVGSTPLNKIALNQEVEFNAAAQARVESYRTLEP